ncbi:MAG TPA: hypothetical protein VFR18_14915 [Terriglobia bacterium]|nr:hypothetical protein [Terriglobia bacterium]
MKVAMLLVVTMVATAQTEFTPPRLADGRPNFGGIWMAASLSAAFNVEEHGASYGTPAGPSVIVDPPGGKLPYLPGMRERAADNDRHRERDPVGQCHMHGVPRIMFPPFPLEIVQDGNYVVILAETEHGVRIIPTDGRPFLKDYFTWNGDSRGHWEGDTLVVEVRGLNGRSWLDQAGNFMGAGAHVVERFRLTGKDTLDYQATVENPAVFSRPFTLRVPLRRRPADVELLEYGCIEGERDAAHLPAVNGEKK